MTSPTPAMRRNVVVVGAPRSGTSLTASVFAQHGYHVGAIEDEGRREGDVNNPAGYFEADDLVQRNVEILAAAGYPHHNTWLFEPVDAATVARIARQIPRDTDRAFVASYAGQAPWLWKDPRLCFTLAYWLKLLDLTTTSIVLTQRDPQAIRASLERTGWAAEHGRTIDVGQLAQHVATAAATLKQHGVPHVRVKYEDYLAQPERVARGLSEAAGFPISVADLKVRPALNHMGAIGRLRSRLRRSLDRGILRSLRVLRPVVPARLLDILLPERRRE